MGAPCSRRPEIFPQGELGQHLANVLTCSDIDREKCRETCARFHHAWARVPSLDGDVDRSRAQIRAAVEAWPAIRGELVEDRELEALWSG